ncbi:hypothetical protein ABXN37_24350 [Piscinibacter sakaiensis]|uniref:Uncharacterized protein n=1 Tax=Piscinibacter sakaiensis TaxID=1547922 RepID=A0A0K8P7T7_PISS1|nr:hypothetical protein [Piscinibacter sakaiensis]GAP38260.1 hypothetical protein ISF6_4454 [Piscinibacter sakaiensis]
MTAREALAVDAADPVDTPEGPPPTALDPAARAQQLPLQHGRRLSLASSGGDDLVEVRGAGGALELRIRLTPEGPVLQMDSLKLSLKAAESVEVDCAQFSVRARDALTLASEGALGVQAGGDARVEAQGEVRVAGTMIYLN